MHQLGSEEKAALLLTATDDNDENHNQELFNSPVIARRARTYHRSTGTHPVFCFALILGAFILGCISGVLIVLYRMSQEAEQVSIATNIDLSIRTKLFKSITKTNFLNVNNSVESEIDAANKLYTQWQTFAPVLTHLNKFSYEIDASKFAPMDQWSGITLLDRKKDTEIFKIDRLSTDDILSTSSLVKSGTIDGDAVYYANYGRQEDFAYLFQNRISLENQAKSILFLRRRATVISQIEQIHQAIHYGFDGLVLFDDNENQQITTTNSRHSFFREWARYRGTSEKQNFLDGILNDKDHSISVLLLSYDDVQRIFTSLQPDSNQWVACPDQWYNKSTSLKLGGSLTNFQFRLVVNVQTVKIQLPVVMSSIQGTMEGDRFIMIGSQLRSTNQNRILNEIVEVFTNQVKNGWKPRRSIVFCAWSGFDYDQYPARRWLLDNSRLINTNLLSYIDLGNGILANSTLNLHGSPLLEQIAHHAADAVASPLKHDHTCHHRQMQTKMTDNEGSEHHHDHGKKRRDSEDEDQCEPHKYLDEWLRAVRNRFNTNQTLPIVQNIDPDSTAALFQLQYGIPSILIEMTEEQALVNDKFYTRHAVPSFDPNIQPDVYVAYTQFVSEVIRQLIDEPLIAFNLTNYADQIDQQVNEYLVHFDVAYNALSYHIGQRGEFTKTWNDLTKSMREIQARIDQTSSNDYVRFVSFNRQLVEFERLFLGNDQLPGMNSPEKIYRHILIGPAFGLTNTVVPFPLLSNLFFNIPEDPSTEICDESRVYWFKLKEHIRLINRSLNGFDGLLTKDN